MLHDHDHSASTLVITLEWLAVTHKNDATTYRIPLHDDAADLVAAILMLLDRRAVTITRILLDVSGSRAGTYRRAAVAIADAIGAQIGQITDIGHIHFETLLGEPGQNKALWIAEGLRKIREVAPLAASIGTAISPVFEVVNIPTSIYTPEESARRLRSLACECRRAKSFWRKIDTADLATLAETY